VCADLARGRDGACCARGRCCSLQTWLQMLHKNGGSHVFMGATVTAGSVRCFHAVQMHGGCS